MELGDFVLLNIKITNLGKNLEKTLPQNYTYIFEDVDWGDDQNYWYRHSSSNIKNSSTYGGKKPLLKKLLSP